MSMEKQLRDRIEKALRKATMTNAPGVCQAVQSASGYKRVEGRIIEMVIHDGITPEAAIPYVENIM